MNTLPRALLALLSCSTVLACGDASAQARGGAGAMKYKEGTDPAVSRNAELMELDAWLRRLVGKFRISTSLQPNVGEAECVGIGGGSGVHCLFRFTSSRPGQWSVQVFMFGLDLDAPGVRYLRLRSDGLAEAGVAKLHSDAVLFSGDCPIIQPPAGPGRHQVPLWCRQELRIQARPEASAIRFRFRTTQAIQSRGGDGRLRTSSMSFDMQYQLDRMATPAGP